MVTSSLCWGRVDIGYKGGITMHECPFCGQMCDCDGEDLFMNIIPDDHWCSCMEEEEEDEEEKCPKCGSIIGHRINCPNGIAFTKSF